MGKQGELLIRVANRSGRMTSLNRPLQLLYPLEIRNLPQDTNTSCDDGNSPNSQDQEVSDNQTPRPRRDAARKGEERRRIWTRELQD